jgi:hypothetical protein
MQQNAVSLDATPASESFVNTLLEASSRMPFHTDMGQVFRALDGWQYEYDWLLTEIDTVATSAAGLPSVLQPVDRDRALVVPGTELSAMLAAYPMQFLWGVFSAIPPQCALNAASLNVVPCADGNSDHWSAVRCAPQHPLAEVEIVCWDSSATLLIGASSTLTRAFRSYFPEAVDLDVHNARLSPRGGV